MTYGLRIAAVVLLAFPTWMNAAVLTERDGRFEWNWSTGNVRYYGTSLSQESDGKTWRPAEQRAWSDGLAHVEQQLPAVVAKRLGSPEMQVPQKFTKLLGATRSVNTTYYGDSRIKVTLETPFAEAIKQVTGTTVGGSTPGTGDVVVIIKVPKNTSPSVAFSIVDESGKELVSSKQMLASIVSGAPVPKWFKSTASAPDVPALIEKSSELKATASKGVLKVQSTDWRPEYASLVTSGQVAVVVQ